MSNNKPHPSGELPPLKLRTRDININDEITTLQDEKSSILDTISLPSSSLSPLIPIEIKPPTNVTIVDRDADESSTPILQLLEIESPLFSSTSSPFDEDFAVIHDLSPRSAADFVLRKCFSYLQRPKTDEELTNLSLFSDSVTGFEDELRKCARKQAELILIRDCCVRVTEAEKFVESLKCVTNVVKKSIEDLKSDSNLISSDLFNDDVILQLGEDLQTQSKHWFFIENRVKTSEWFKKFDSEYLKTELEVVKNKLNFLLHSSLVRLEIFLILVMKYIVLLDTAQNMPRFAWQNFVKITEKYNEVLSEFLQKSDKKTPKYFSIKRILHLIANECSVFGLNMFYEMLIEPQNEFNTSSSVDWLPKSANLCCYQNEAKSSTTSDYFSDNKNAKGEPDPNSNGDLVLEQGDLVSHLLSCVTDCSNLISISSDIEKNGQNSNGEKCVHWLDDSKSESTPVLMDLYVELLRKEILKGLELKWIQSCQNENGEMGSVVFWTDSMILLVVSRAQQLAKKVDAVHVAKIANNIAMSLKLKAALAAWDERFCTALVASSNHRYPPVLISDKIMGTQAGFALAAALEPLLALLPQFRHTGDQNPWDLPELRIIPCLRATLHLASRWLRTSTDQLLASWQIGNYLLITQSDLKHLVDLLKYLSTASLSTLNSGSSSVSLSWRIHIFQVSAWWDEINDINTEIQNISGSAIQKFHQKCSSVCSEAFIRYMPLGKTWRAKYRSYGPPNDHNQYIDDIINAVLEPVLEGVKHLPMPVQISVVSMATKAFCENWMIYICKHKIKFSLHGALLLRLDVVRLSTWLQSVPQLSVEAQQSIQALDVLRRLHGSSLLLTRQPRTRQRFRKTRVSPVMSIADLNCEADKSENGCSVEELYTRDSVTDEDFVPNKEEWLALRVCRSPTRWQSLWCLR